MHVEVSYVVTIMIYTTLYTMPFSMHFSLSLLCFSFLKLHVLLLYAPYLYVFIYTVHIHRCGFSNVFFFRLIISQKQNKNWKQETTVQKLFKIMLILFQVLRSLSLFPVYTIILSSLHALLVLYYEICLADACERKLDFYVSLIMIAFLANLNAFKFNKIHFRDLFFQSFVPKKRANLTI